jgi:hypothetical protein
MTLRRALIVPVVALVLAAAPARAADPASLLSYKSPSLEAARAQALDWLTALGKTDAATRAAFDALWQPGERPMLDRVADTLGLGNADAAQVLAGARNPNSRAPLDLPTLVRDKQQPLFFRANLTLAYAKALSGRRAFEPSLEALRTVKASEVIDPAAYYFHRAVAEYSLRLRDEARRSIAGLGDVTDAPARYRALGELMAHHMDNWKDRDLGWIADSMGNISRRLDLGWGGEQTQKLQRDVLAALDDLIREPPPGPEGGPDPRRRPDGAPQPGSAAPNPGPRPPIPGKGIVDAKDLIVKAENWGLLPEKVRANVRIQMIRTLPPAERQAIEEYFKRLSRTEP